jgi:hypothetical protein
MNAKRLVLVALCAAPIMACDRNTEGTPFEPDLLAAVRFVNAVPDTMALDYRVVDIATNAGMYDAPFRNNQGFYNPILAGEHTIKVFLSSTDPAVTQTAVYEAAHTFAAGVSYTFLHYGFMRSGQTPAVAVSMVEDTPPTPAAGRIAVRALNLASGIGGVDVFVGTATTGLPSATATWANLAFGAFTPYVELDTAAYRVAATATGTTTPLLVANTAAPAGLAASGTASSIAGVRMAGSALTIVVFPRSVAGSPAPQTSAFTAPAVAFLYDRRPQ